MGLPSSHPSPADATQDRAMADLTTYALDDGVATITMDDGEGQRAVRRTCPRRSPPLSLTRRRLADRRTALATLLETICAGARRMRFMRVAALGVREAAGDSQTRRRQGSDSDLRAASAQARAGGRGSALVGAPVDPESAGGQRGQDADPPRQPLVGGRPHRLGQFHRRSTYPRWRLVAPATRASAAAGSASRLGSSLRRPRYHLGLATARVGAR